MRNSIAYKTSKNSDNENTGDAIAAGKNREYKVLLIDAHRRYYDGGLNYFENIGLYLLASYVESKGYSAAVACGEPVDMMELIYRSISRAQCKVIGFYCDYDNQFDVKTLSFKIKKKYQSRVEVIVGGPQAEFLADDFFDDALCDYIVTGEGELTLLELLEYIFRSNSACYKDINDICGVKYRNGKCELIQNPRRVPIADLDSIPPPRRNNSLGNDFRNSEKITVLTSRGCNLKCAFCFETASVPAKIRYRSLDNVFKEIETAVFENEKLKCVVFVDSNFTANARRVSDVCDGFRKLGKNLSWVCESHIKPVLKNNDMLSEMVNAGLFRLQVGVESGVNRTLAAYNKNITTADVERFLEVCADKKLPQVVTNFIIGGAFETETTFYRTLIFAEKIIKTFPALIDIYSSYLFPYPGTPIHKNPQNYGLKINDFQSLTSMSDYPVVETLSLDKRKIFEFKKEFDYTIINLMQNIVPNLGYNDLLKHCRGYHEYKIKSLWYEVISRERNVDNFMNLILSGRAVHSSKVTSDDSLLEYKPIRTIDIALCSFDSNGNLCYSDKTGILSKDETFIFELCAAKLSVKEIAVKFNEKIQNHTNAFDGALRETLAILRKLERNYIVAFCP